MSNSEISLPIVGRKSKMWQCPNDITRPRVPDRMLGLHEVLRIRLTYALNLYDLLLFRMLPRCWYEQKIILIG